VRWALFRVMEMIMNRIRDEWNEAIHLDGFIALRREV